MKRRTTYLIFLLVFILTACSAGNPVASPTGTSVSDGENSTSEVETTQTPSPEDTSTPSPEPETWTETPEQPTATITLTPTPAIQSSGPEEYPEGYNPLTGLPVEDTVLLERRPVAVKIQLFPRGGRPPWGVSLADIVYDYYQNDGLTRLNAIFYGYDAELIGPIRSARIFDENVMRMYKSIFAFGGADWRVFNRIYDTDLRDLMVVEGSHNCPPMCRIDPNAMNYLISNSAELSQYITDNGVENGRQDLSGMTFDNQIQEGGRPGEQVEVRWSISAYLRWKYNPESGSYIREQDTIEAGNRESEEFSIMTDRLNEEQVTAENIIVIPLNHVNLFPEAKFEIMDVQLPVGETGTAYAFRDGQIYEVTWNRPEEDSVLYLTFPDGSDFAFKPGKTWFEIVGKGSIVTEPEEGTWRYEFRY